MPTLRLTATLLMVLLLLAVAAAATPPPGMEQATFAVHCYDVGAHTLAGKPGVVAVERSWSGAREVDRVVYDPQRVSLGQLENWLKNADTYVGTLEAATSTGPAQAQPR